MNLHNFWVIGVISNPVRYKSRYDLHKRWIAYLQKQGINNILTVELQLGDRPHECHGGQTVQFRHWDELWHKENMINQGIERLPDSWEYVAILDCDVFFLNNNWLEETAHALQRYMVVQPWQTCLDLGPNGETLQVHNSFVFSYLTGLPFGKSKYGYYHYPFWHPGFAWAYRREAIDHLGGMLDHAILGSGDHHMAMGLIGRMAASYPEQMSQPYKDRCLQWEYRAEKHIKRDIGYVPGTLGHWWHGKKKTRFYVERWKILTDNNYNPETDVKRDWQGLYQLEVTTPRQIKLRDDIRRYFNSRLEDSIDVE